MSHEVLTIPHKRALLACVRCGCCRSVCPVFEKTGWESFNARGRMMIADRLLDGSLPDASAIDSLNTCTTCGICTEICPAGIDPPVLIEDARRGLVGRGFATARHASLSQKIALCGNTFGDSIDRLSWLSDRSRLRERAEYVYFVGCMNSYRYRDTAARTFDILERFGATVLPAEQCCGSPLLRTGFDASRQIRANLDQIRKIGAHTVITGCAGCYTTLLKSYFGTDRPGGVRVLSVPEFLDEHLDELDLRRLDLAVAYHDPCHLGRRHKIYDQPRHVIESICTLLEMKASRDRSRCCGGGGGVRAGYSDLSLEMAARRLEDVPDGADYIVTSCPLCVRNLSDAGAGSRVIDLLDLVAMALP